MSPTGNWACNQGTSLEWNQTRALPSEGRRSVHRAKPVRAGLRFHRNMNLLRLSWEWHFPTNVPLCQEKTLISLRPRIDSFLWSQFLASGHSKNSFLSWSVMSLGGTLGRSVSNLCEFKAEPNALSCLPYALPFWTFKTLGHSKRSVSASVLFYYLSPLRKVLR